MILSRYLTLQSFPSNSFPATWKYNWVEGVQIFGFAAIIPPPYTTHTIQPLSHLLRNSKAIIEQK